MPSFSLATIEIIRKTVLRRIESAAWECGTGEVLRGLYRSIGHGLFGAVPVAKCLTF